jgi:RNA polymerase sigma-70 factor (ECF subfamily)
MIQSKPTTSVDTRAGLPLPLDPEKLVQKAQEDPEAFGELFDRYYSRVFNYVRYRCADLETAQDLTSLVFERLLQKIHQYSPARGLFEPWLFAMVRNIVADHHRSWRAREISWEDLHQSSSGDLSPESLVIRRESQFELLQALENLDDRSRDLLGLKFAARLSNRQIAQLTRMSESNVGVVIYRAIAQLRLVLQAGNVNSKARRWK